MPATTAATKTTKLNEAAVLDLVDPKWHSAFLSFVRKGKATPEFLAYLDTDSSAKRAVSMVFDAQTRAWEKLAAKLPPITSPGGQAPQQEKERIVRAETEKLAALARQTQGSQQELSIAVGSVVDSLARAFGLKIKI